MIENKYTKIINGKTNITRKNKILDTYLNNIVKRQMGTLDIEDTGIYQTDNQFYLNNIFFKLDNPIPNIEKIGKNYLNNTAESTNVAGLEITNNGDNSLSIEGNAEGHYKTVQGTSFTLTDASSTKQASITELKGNTTQEGTPTPSSPVEVKTVSGDNNIVVNGKNIIGFIEYSNTNFNTTTYIDISNVMQIKSRYGIATDFQSGTSYMNITLKNAYDNTQIVKFKNLKPNTKYTISCKLTTNITAGYINVFGDTYSYSATSRVVTFTTNASGEKEINTHLYISGITKTSGLYINLTDIQLEQGDQATTYIAHQGNSYRVDLGGKNNWYIEPQTKNGVSLSYDTDGAIILNGTSTSNFTAFTSIVNFSGTYTISTSNTQIQGNTFIRTRNSSNTIIHSLLLNQTSRTQTQTNNDIAILEITIGANNITYNNFKIYAQLEKRKCSNTIQSIYCKPNRTK